MQPNRDPSSQPRVSTFRLETFSDGVFAIAVTLLALQLKLPDLEGATTAGAVLHAHFTFLLVCLAVRREVGKGDALDELVVPKMIRAANAAWWLGLFGSLLVAEVPLPNAAVWVWLLLLVVGGRLAVRAWSARHRRRLADPHVE